MENTIKTFEAWKLSLPRERHKLSVYFSHRLQSENILFLICAWDYIYRPCDAKASGLRDLFIRASSVCELNVSSSSRTKALLQFSPATIERSFAKHESQQRHVFKSRRSGFLSGGAGNYNLVVRGLEFLVPEVSRLLGNPEGIDFQSGEIGRFSRLHHYSMKNALPHVEKYWGGDFKDLI